MDAYSILMAAALGFSVVALLAAIWARFVKPGAAGQGRRLARSCGRLALYALVGSLAVHLAIGHRPGTERALGPIAFVGEHPVLLLVAGLAFVAIRLARH